MLATMTSKVIWLLICAPVILMIAPCSEGSTEPPSVREIRVRPQDKNATFPFTWPPEYKGHALILVKVTDNTEVATVTPKCRVEGFNGFHDRVQGSPTPSGCDVVLSNPVKGDEGLYEIHASTINGTLIPGQFKIIVEAHPGSGGSKTADTSKVLAYGAVFLAACLPFLL